jgi:hypothetical protein
MTTAETTETPALQPNSPRSAGAPLAVAGSATVGVVLALAVIAIGLVAVRDAAVAAGWAPGRQWIPMAVDAVDGLAPASWMAIAAFAVAILGLLMIAVALAPRRRTAVPLTAGGAVFLRRADVATIAASAAADVPGVLRARARLGRRRVVIRAAVTSAVDGVSAAVSSSVHAELAVLQRVPKIVVRTREVG